MSLPETGESLTVVSLGLGKAGVDLHGKIWDSIEGFSVTRIGYDTDPARRTAAREAGIIVVDQMTEITDYLQNGQPHVIDNTTASGEHAASTRAMLDMTTSNGLTPRAWLLEKPVVTSEEEKLVMEEALSEIGARVFVNENYLASLALDKGRRIIAEQRASGNTVETILVHFVKDRVPNVILDNRFTDIKGLAVYGIEMPHQLAIASALFGSELDTRDVSEGGSIVTNRFLHDIDGIEESEGNVTVLEQDGTTITLRQGLGPFDFTPDNSLVRRSYDWRTNEAERFAQVGFSDGSTLLLTFDPVVGAPRYHSKVEMTDCDGQQVSEEVFGDNTLRNLIGAVATFAASNGKLFPSLLEQLSPEAAMRYYQQLRELRENAGQPVRIEHLANNGVLSIESYLASLESEKQAREQK